MEKLEIIENLRIDTNTNKKKRDAWSTITNLFNKVSKNNRTFDQIQNQWRKTKSLTKTNNNAYLRQIKQTGGCPPPTRLNSFDEELVGRLPKHFEHDYNLFDSNGMFPPFFFPFRSFLTKLINCFEFFFVNRYFFRNSLSV